MYGISEFWTGPKADRPVYTSPLPPMICPAAYGTLERRNNMPCSAGAVGPTKNVSIGFNRRLDTGTRDINQIPRPARVYLAEKTLQFPDVPLVFDVDGAKAAGTRIMPYYAAPALASSADIYSAGKFWFPSFRHRGAMSVGFIGGHVLSSRQPLNEPWGRWAYQPEIPHRANSVGTLGRCVIARIPSVASLTARIVQLSSFSTANPVFRVNLRFLLTQGWRFPSW